MCSSDLQVAGGVSGLSGPPTARVGQFIVELLSQIDGVDWGRFDNDGPDGVPNSGDDDGYVDVLLVVHPTRGAECGGTDSGNRIWSHQWTLVDPVTRTKLTSYDQISLACVDDALEVQLRLNRTAALVDTTGNPIGFDIGVPGLGLSVDGNVTIEVGFDFNFGFGISASDGFYFDTSDANELEISFNATIPGLKATGELGFLQVEVADESDGVDAKGKPRAASVFCGGFYVDFKDPIGSGNRLTFNDITTGFPAGKLVAVTLGAAADINLDLTVSFGSDARFPRLLIELDVD